MGAEQSDYGRFDGEKNEMEQSDDDEVNVEKKMVEQSDYGDGDIDPFGNGNGNLFGPHQIRNQFNGNNRNDQDGNRPPLVPPNARFDPYGPDGMSPDPENNKQKNLEPNNMQMVVASDYCQSQRKIVEPIEEDDDQMMVEYSDYGGVNAEIKINIVEFLMSQPSNTPTIFNINTFVFSESVTILHYQGIKKWSEFVPQFAITQNFPQNITENLMMMKYGETCQFHEIIMIEVRGMFSVMKIVAKKHDEKIELALSRVTIAAEGELDVLRSRCHQLLLKNFADKAPKSLTHQ